MGKIKMQNLNDLRVKEAFEKFVISKKAQGVKDVTVRTYHYHFRSLSRYLDVEKHFSELTQEDLENMVVGLREAGVASNTVSCYLRVFVTFLHWCSERGYTTLSMKNLKQEETVKITYTDEELERLLKRPKKSGNFFSLELISIPLQFLSKWASARNEPLIILQINQVFVIHIDLQIMQ